MVARTPPKLRKTLAALNPVLSRETPNTGEWRRMSLPALLVGETIGEILHASQFAKELVSAVNYQTPSKEDPKNSNSSKAKPENCTEE